MKTVPHILLPFFCLLTFCVFSQVPVAFVENKGQWDKRVSFSAEVPGGAIFIQPTGYTVLQRNADDMHRAMDLLHGHLDGDPKNGVTVRSHAYHVSFVGGREKPQTAGDKVQETYNNYFIGNDPSKWAEHCRTFGGVTLKDVYPNVDVRYYSDNGQLKYDIMVFPGGDVSKIALRYEGTDGLEVKDKELRIKTSVGEIRELYPYTYQADIKGRRQIGAKYVVKDNVVRFDIKEYNKNEVLVIDPTWIFSSFSKSTADNWGFTATYGPDGSMFGGGIVMGAGFPVSSGAFQETWGGGSDDIKTDMGIIKLSPNGVNRIYATYIGGSGNDQPHSLFCDPQGNLVIAGRTSSANYPVTGSNGQIGGGGGYDICVTKLNATGTAIIGSKKIGGGNADGVNISNVRSRNSLNYNYGDDGRSEVVLDGANNIYVASSTRSGNFPMRGNSFQTVLDGEQDGIILKLTPDVSDLVFSSFIGGNKNDAAYVLSVNPISGELFVAGGTESDARFPGMNNPMSPYSGGIEGYVTRLSNNGANLSVIQSTYIGTSGTDQVYGVQFDKQGFPYIMGQTTGSWVARNATWSQANGKQFIAKLRPDLSGWVYSTMFGSGQGNVPDISPVAFLVDRCENVYVSGWGGEMRNAPTFLLNGTAQLSRVNNLRSTDGKDFYFFVLKRNATAQLYGDFFGEVGGFTDHVDGGTSRFDANGVIYQAICGDCEGGQGDFPIFPPNVFGNTNPSGRCNLAMVKIAMDLAGTAGSVQSTIEGVPRDTAGCVPLTVDFRDTVRSAISYEWNFDFDNYPASPTIATTSSTISHTFTEVRNYRVMMVAIDSASCNIRDTSYLTIKVGSIKATPLFTPVKLEPCDAFKYRFYNTSTVAPTHPFTSNSFIWDFGDGKPIRGGLDSIDYTFPGPGTYIVKLTVEDDRYCNSPDTYIDTLYVASMVDARFFTMPTGCAPYNAYFLNRSMGGFRFFWDFGDNTPVVEAYEPQHRYALPGIYTVKLVVLDSATCNKIDSVEHSIEIFASPTADFSILSPQPPPVNTPTRFRNNSSNDATSFKWLFGDGDSLVTRSRGDVTHEYNTSGSYEAVLIAYNNQGCTDTARLPVVSEAEPAVDVPTAFTPLSGDMNSKVFVRGFDIAKLKFTIYNRWGQKVFESDSKNIGWDGKFKGALQPMDAYAYTLEVEFNDGSRATKKGDITLIR